MTPNKKKILVRHTHRFIKQMRAKGFDSIDIYTLLLGAGVGGLRTLGCSNDEILEFITEGNREVDEQRRRAMN